MKVGDYVRTEDGIKKVLKYTYNERYENGHCVWFDNKDYGILFTDEEVNKMKPSPNIIDLIEENDLIEIEYKISTGENQKEIVQVIKNVNNKLFIKTYTEHYVFIEDIEKTIYKIKGIITHEQIESMEYKVKE